MQEKRGSVGAGVFWMLFLSFLLGWLPLVGPFLAGLVGGKKAGGVGKALLAVFLPSIVFALVLFALATSLTNLPLIGAIAASGGFVLSLAGVGPLLLGAIIGGLLA
jgi:hypothetical protein